jgi:hypothetical protein
MNFEDVEPIRDARRGRMSYEASDDAEATFLQCVIQIAAEHFAAAGMELTIDKKRTSYWFLFGVNLRSALIPRANMLEDEKYLALLRGLFAEVFDFLVYAYDGSPAYTIHELSRGFGSGMAQFLPERAKPVLMEVCRIAEAENEELRYRQDQMGY